jgi:hypothetical protein
MGACSVDNAATLHWWPAHLAGFRKHAGLSNMAICLLPLKSNNALAWALVNQFM